MGLAAVVKEDLPGEPVGEVEAFRAAVWPDAAVYLDEVRSFVRISHTFEPRESRARGGARARGGGLLPSTCVRRNTLWSIH